MLAVEPLRGSNGDEREGARAAYAIGDGFGGDEAALLEDISFSDLFMGIDVTVEDDDGDLLPDLELDPAEIFAEFSVGTTEDSGATTVATGGVAGIVLNQDLAGQGEEEASAMSNLKEDSSSNDVPSQGGGGDKAGRKPSPPPAKGSQGKRKAKVDWTPELHRRFVQAVEQLGIDKAVPSRILELMGIDCLTRHNIASHLQKYRSHRKHLLAREAEAVSWSQRRQMYGAPAKRDVNPWLAPTIGFPPPPPAPPQVQQFRPLHVWGHPPGEAPPMAHPWLRPLAPRSVPPPSWVVQPPDPASYWHHPYPRLQHTFVGREGWITQAMTQGTPCFPQPLPAATRFAAPAVPGVVPHHAMYRAAHAAAAAAPPPPPPAPINNHSSSQLQLDAHPSIESIDAAIGDVLAKPWLPLPLGLKPPAVDSVLVELQKQGVPKVPPAACG